MKVRIQYHSGRSFSTDCHQQLQRGGLFLRLDCPAQRGQPVAVEIELPDGSRHEFQAEVLQVVPGQGLALDFSRSDPQRLQALLLAERTLGTSSAGSEPALPPTVELLEDTKAAGSAPAAPPTRGTLQAQLQQMTVAQKRQAALHGNKDMRWALIRDRNKTLHQFVLQNPALTLDEVEQITKLPGVNPDALRYIARNREWTRSQAVCRNLVRNPKTPLPEALQLLQKLPANEIRALARSNNVRTPIQQAARKMVLG